MAIGFDTIGSGAVGESSGDASDVIIFAPEPLAIVITTAVPVVTAGASVAPPSASISAVANNASIRAGTKIDAPSAGILVEALAAEIQISATITAPGAAIAVSSGVPFVGGGAFIVAPSSMAVAMTKESPFVTAGKSQFAPSVGISVSVGQANISISAIAYADRSDITITAPVAEVLGGNYIEAANTVTMNTRYGEIGSSAIAEFAIGEGDIAERIVKVPPFIIIQTNTPFVTAGKTIKPPAALISLNSGPGEIHSRGRKLRVLAIAS